MIIMKQFHGDAGVWTGIQDASMKVMREKLPHEWSFSVVVGKTA